MKLNCLPIMNVGMSGGASGVAPITLSIAFTTVQFIFKFKLPSTKSVTIDWGNGDTEVVVGQDSTKITKTSNYVAGAATYQFSVDGDFRDITYIESGGNADHSMASGTITQFARCVNCTDLQVMYWQLTGDIDDVAALPLSTFYCYQCSTLTGDWYSFRNLTSLTNIIASDGGSFEFSGTDAFADTSFHFATANNNMTSTSINNLIISFSKVGFSGRTFDLSGNSIRTSASNAEYATLAASNTVTVEAMAAGSIGVIYDGQSNSSGRGSVSSLPGYLTGVLTGCYIWKDGDWKSLEAGVSADGNGDSAINQHGSELELAYQLQAETGNDVYIVKHGYGSTQLAQISPSNDHNASSVGEYHDSIVNEVLYAQCDEITWLSYIWSQGEEDSKDETKSLAYEANLTAKITALRSDLSLASLAIIVNKIHDPSPSSYYTNIETAESNVATGDADVYLNDCDTFELNIDAWHYTSDGLVDRGNAEFVIIRDNILP